MAYDKTHFITSYLGIADIASLVPIIGIVSNVTNVTSNDTYIVYTLWIGFLYVFRLESVFNFIQYKWPIITKEDKTENSSPNDISYQTWRLVLSIIMFVMIATGIVFAINLDDHSSFESPVHTIPLTWFSSLYFVMVTTTTLGYVFIPIIVN